MLKWQHARRANVFGNGVLQSGVAYTFSLLNALIVIGYT
jgi:hypothetical protein